MGYTQRGSITDFWPDNTSTKLYLPHELPFQDLYYAAKHHFGAKFKMSTVFISSEHTHTSCIYYDLHDPSDYTTFTVVTLKESVDGEL